MAIVARPRSVTAPLDFGVFRSEASLSVGIDDLPAALSGSVFAEPREGLGLWDFVDLDTGRGRIVIGQPESRTFQATIWCEMPLVPVDIKALCEGLFQARVLVMAPETGAVV